jgi:hypothetical protein
VGLGGEDEAAGVTNGVKGPAPYTVCGVSGGATRKPGTGARSAIALRPWILSPNHIDSVMTSRQVSSLQLHCDHGFCHPNHIDSVMTSRQVSALIAIALRPWILSPNHIGSVMTSRQVSALIAIALQLRHQ